jgi:exopolysaccharide biosynthesis protein
VSTLATHLALILSLALAAAIPSAAATECLSGQGCTQIAPGLVHRTITRGRDASTAGFRLVLGTFERQSEADALLARLEKEGVPALPESDGTVYRVVSPVLPAEGQAEELARDLASRGLVASPIIERVSGSITGTAGPWRIHVLEADPELVEARIAHAFDAAIGLETTAELASRRGALAAVNGGYFRMQGLLAGDSQGVLMLDGALLSEPDRGRAAVGFYEQDGRTRSVFGRLGFVGSLHLADGSRIALDGINRPRGDEELVLFTPEMHRTTLTPPGGAEVVLENGVIGEIRSPGGSTPIPCGARVLSIGAERVAEVLGRLRSGDHVQVETGLRSLLPDPEGEWTEARFIVGGGPLLLHDGQRLEEPATESISQSFFLARHPRTAVGARADGTLVLVTVDGRRPSESVGMSIPELTDLMLELGCRHAINLDGGGSTTMVVSGELVNHPSGSAPRRNADAVLVFPRTGASTRTQRASNP